MSMSPLSALHAELLELDAAVDVAPAPGSQPAGLDFSKLRLGLDAQAQTLAHEAARFGLVVASAPEGGALDPVSATAVCRSMGAAANVLVAAVQVLTTTPPSSSSSSSPPLLSGLPPATAALCAGAAFSKEVRGTAHALLRALSDLLLVGSAATDASRGGLSKAGMDAVVAAAGRVLSVCEAVPRLPATHAAAVRRRLLAVAKLIKTSGQEIAAESGVTAAKGGAAAGGEGGGATIPLLTTPAERVAAGLAVLKACMGLVKAALDAADEALGAAKAATTAAAAAKEGGGDVAAAAAEAGAPSSSVDALSASLAALSVSSGSAAGAGVLDAVSDATAALDGAVIDFADALNSQGGGGGGKGGGGGVNDDEDDWDDDEDDEDEDGDEEEEEEEEDTGAAATRLAGAATSLSSACSGLARVSAAALDAALLLDPGAAAANSAVRTALEAAGREVGVACVKVGATATTG
jgi:hypothetical protein